MASQVHADYCAHFHTPYHKCPSPITLYYHCHNPFNSPHIPTNFPHDLKTIHDDQLTYQPVRLWAMGENQEFSEKSNTVMESTCKLHTDSTGPKTLRGCEAVALLVMLQKCDMTSVTMSSTNSPSEPVESVNPLHDWTISSHPGLETNSVEFFFQTNLPLCKVYTVGDKLQISPAIYKKINNQKAGLNHNLG